MQNIFSIFYVVRMLVGTKQLYTQKWFKKNSKCPLRPLVTLVQCCIWSFLIFGPFWSKVLAHEWSERLRRLIRNAVLLHLLTCTCTIIIFAVFETIWTKKLIEKSRMCQNHKPQPTNKKQKKRTNTNTCKANKQMHEKHKDQLPLPQARWSQC